MDLWSVSGMIIQHLMATGSCVCMLCVNRFALRERDAVNDAHTHTRTQSFGLKYDLTALYASFLNPPVIISIIIWLLRGHAVFSMFLRE